MAQPTLKRILYVPDTHRPYHDKQAWKLFLKAGRLFKPDILVCMGDFADFYSVSRHTKSPHRDRKLKWELADVNVGLDELDGLGATDKIFLAGNHCLTEQHRALTKHGWAHVDTLEEGMEIATCQDGFLAWEPIQRIVRRAPVPAETVFKVDQRCVRFEVTSGHNVLGRSNGKEWKRPAKECPDEFDIPMSIPSGLPEYPLTDDQLRLAAWASTDVYYAPSNSIIFYQSGEGYRQITDLLDRLGIDYTLKRRARAPLAIAGKILKSTKPAYEIRLRKKEGLVVRALTGLSKKGRLPVWFTELSDRQWNVFSDTLIEADGSWHEAAQTARMFYGKKELCEDVQIGCVIHGQRASISEYHPTHFRVNIVDRVQSRVQDFRATEQPLTEHVWCVTVASGNFLTECQGTVTLTGNCSRLTRYLEEKAPELFDVVDIPSLFHLSRRGWRYVPYGKHIKIGKLYHSHDVGATGRYACHKALDYYKKGIVTGHVHRIGYVVEGNLAGDTQVSANFGWLGDKKAIDYAQEGKVERDSALGFGIGYLHPKTGFVYLVPVPIVKNTCVAEGQLVTL